MYFETQVCGNKGPYVYRRIQENHRNIELWEYRALGKFGLGIQDFSDIESGNKGHQEQMKKRGLVTKDPENTEVWEYRTIGIYDSRNSWDWKQRTLGP